MNIVLLGIAILLALLIGYFFRAYLIDSMSNLEVAQEAQEYLNEDSINLTTELDTYLYTNFTVIPKGEHHDDEDKNQLDDNDDNSDNDSDSDSDGGSDGGDGGD